MNLVKKILFGSKINELVYIGIQQFEDENYFSSISYFSHALDINDQNPTALLYRAKAYLEVNSLDKAQTDLEELVNVDNITDAEAYLLLSKIYLQQNENIKSVQNALKYLEYDNESIRSKYYLARVKYLNKEFSDALKFTDLIIGDGCEDYNVHYLKSLILFAQDNFMSSLHEIDVAISHSEVYDHLYNLRGLINIQIDNYDEAIKDFNHAIRYNPLNPIYYFNKAKTNLKNGDLIEAKNNICNSIEFDPDNKSFYLFKAKCELLSEDYFSAIISYEKAFSLDRKDTDILKKIAEIKILVNDLSGAKSSYNQYLEINDKDSEVYSRLAMVEYKLRNEDNALIFLEKAIDIDASNINALLEKSMIEFKRGNFKETIQILNVLLDKDPQNKKAVNLKAKALILNGDPISAAEQLTLVDNADNNSQYFLLSSQNSFNVNKFDDAEKFLNQIQIDDNNKIPVEIINGIIKLKQGRFEEINEILEEDKNCEFRETIDIYNLINDFKKENYDRINYKLAGNTRFSKSTCEKLQPILNYYARPSKSYQTN